VVVDPGISLRALPERTACPSIVVRGSFDELPCSFHWAFPNIAADAFAMPGCAAQKAEGGTPLAQRQVVPYPRNWEARNFQGFRPFIPGARLSRTSTLTQRWQIDCSLCGRREAELPTRALCRGVLKPALKNMPNLEGTKLCKADEPSTRQDTVPFYGKNAFIPCLSLKHMKYIWKVRNLWPVPVRRLYVIHFRVSFKGTRNTAGFLNTTQH